MKNQSTKGSVGVEAVAAIAIGSALLAAGAWIFTRAPMPLDEAFEAVVVDVSPSAAPSSLCADVERVASRALRDHRGVTHVTLYATGDRASGDLTRIGAVERQPQRALMEQHDSASEQLELLGRVKALCAKAPTRKESPIFRSVAACVASMSANDCGAPGKHCRCWVRTDGIEEEDKIVMARLHGRKQHDGAMSARIDNRNVDVVFCGIAQRSLGRKAGRSPSLADVDAAFRPEFASPERVRFLPSCEPNVADGTNHPPSGGRS